jgi:thiol-disulfide isomerase/thioredoxin
MAPGKLRIAIFVGTIFPCLLSLGLLSSLVAAQDGDPAFVEEIQKGQALLSEHHYEAAIKEFKQANKMQHDACASCYLHMAEAYRGLGAYKNSIENCEKVLQLAGQDTGLLAKAHNQKGIALVGFAQKSDDKKLDDAVGEFRTALQLDSGLDLARFNLGYALLKQGRDADGIRELQAYLEDASDDDNEAYVRKLVANPRRARENYAPDFSFTTLEGEFISSDDLHGKIVLLDFWGTWCEPCRESVPTLIDLRKKFAKEPSFVMIGVSSDTDEDAWRQFVVKHKMDWLEYRDDSEKVIGAFKVEEYPTYIVLDPEGIVRYRKAGYDNEMFFELEEQIKKTLKAASGGGKK